MSEKNHVATAAEIRAAAEADAYEAPASVVLPVSGFTIVVRRPRPKAYALAGVPIPAGLSARLAAADDPAEVKLTSEESALMAVQYARVVVASIVEPKFSLEPREGEISTAMLPDKDQDFLLRYIGGEIDAQGRSLATFRPKRGRAAAGADGAALPMPPERAAEK